MDLVIATDLDGTFLGGSADQRRALYGWIGQQRDRIGLIFVTGRSLDSVAPLLADPGDPAVPAPDLVIGDVGASIATADLDPIDDLERQVRGAWPGEDAVVALFADLDLVRQDVPQRGRVSYSTSSAAAVAAVRARAAAHGFDVVYSCDEYLDVMPAGVDKGRTLRAVLAWAGVADDHVLVCGDTLNDEALYRHGLRGVVVGGAEPALVDATRGRPRTYHASLPGAAGIAQAISQMFGPTFGPTLGERA
jgi:glucosylglycerol-phosphate synthase